MANPPWDSLQLVSKLTILGPNFRTMLNNCYYQPSQVWGIAAPADIRFPGSPSPYGYEYHHGYFHPYSYQVDYSNPGFYIVQMGDGSMVSMTAYGLENLFKSSYGNFCSASAKTVAPKSALSKNKKRATGGKKKAWRKKLKYELGRRANTKLSSNMTIRRIRVRVCKSLEVERKIEPVGNDADKVFDNCPERESDFESKMLEFLQSCRRVEEMLQHMISSAKKHDNQDEDPKLEIEDGNDVSIKEEKILDIDTVQVLEEIPEEETEVWKEVHVFDENPEMEETEQLNEDEEQTLEWEGTYDLICRDYMNQSLHINGVEDGNSVLEHLETREAQMFGKLSTWAPPQAMFNTISLSDFDLSMPLTLQLIVNYGGKLKVIDVLDCTGSAEFIASTLGKVEVESYTWVSSSLPVSSSWKDPIPGCSGIVVVIKCTSLAFILGVKEIIYCCDKMNATNSNYSKAWGIDRVQGELGKVINCYGGQPPTGILFVDFSKTRPPKVTDYFEEMVNMKADQGIDQFIQWINCTLGINVCFLLDTGQGTNVMKRPSVFLGMVAQNLSLLMHAPLWKPENEDMTNLLIEGGSIPMVHVLDALKLYLPLIYTKHFTRTWSYWIFLLELHYVVNSSIVGGLSATGSKQNSLEDILFAYTKLEISFLWHPLYQSPKIFLSQGHDNIESSLLEYCSYGFLHVVALSLIWHHYHQLPNISASLNVDHFVASSWEGVNYLLLLHSFLSSYMVRLSMLLLIFSRAGILFEDITISQEWLIARQGEHTLALSVKLVDRPLTYQDSHSLGMLMMVLVRMLLVVLAANHSYIADEIISIPGTQTCSYGVALVTQDIGTLSQQYKLMSHYVSEHNGAHAFSIGVNFWERMSMVMNISIWHFQYFSILDILRMELVHFTEVTSFLRSLTTTTNLLVIIKIIIASFTFSVGQRISEKNLVDDLGGKYIRSISKVLGKQLVIIAATHDLVVALFVIILHHKKKWRVGGGLMNDEFYRNSLFLPYGD